MKLDAFSLDTSFVSGRSEEILITELKVDWPFHGAQLQPEHSETEVDF